MRNRAGQSTRKMAEKRYRARVWFVLLLAGVVFVILILIFNANALGIGGLGVLGLIGVSELVMNYMEGNAKRKMKEERRAIRGARAEEKIGSMLDALGEDYLVIHDVVSPFGNIDHIVISKSGGAFLIETKAHGGRVTAINGRLQVNGHEPEKDLIGQVLNNTYWLRDRICEATGVTAWITPVLVFTNAFVERMPPIKQVTVINKRYLSGTLQRKAGTPPTSALWEKREQVSAVLSRPEPVRTGSGTQELELPQMEVQGGGDQGGGGKSKNVWIAKCAKESESRESRERSDNRETRKK